MKQETKDRLKTGTKFSIAIGILITAAFGSGWGVAGPISAVVIQPLILAMLAWFYPIDWMTENEELVSRKAANFGILWITATMVIMCLTMLVWSFSEFQLNMIQLVFYITTLSCIVLSIYTLKNLRVSSDEDITVRFYRLAKATAMVFILAFAFTQGNRDFFGFVLSMTFGNPITSTLNFLLIVNIIIFTNRVLFKQQRYLERNPQIIDLIEQKRQIKLGNL
ncbi:hypothetical protein K7J31_002878 [Vibrio parahaemolyticus]|nr:hypothetical protein [Vibrio parahaemolyticus]